MHRYRHSLLHFVDLLALAIWKHKLANGCDPLPYKRTHIKVPPCNIINKYVSIKTSFDINLV